MMPFILLNALTVQVFYKSLKIGQNSNITMATNMKDNQRKQWIGDTCKEILAVSFKFYPIYSNSLFLLYIFICL